MTRFTYQHLVELVEGDEELIVRLVEEGVIEHDNDIARVDVDGVLLARTLWRDLGVEWPGIEVVLHLAAKLRAARARIAELEAKLGEKP